MSHILSDDIIADLLYGDVSNIEEFDEGDDIAYENLDELLLEFPDTVENSNNIVFEEIDENILQIRTQDIPEMQTLDENNDVESFYEDFIRQPKWEKVLWNSSNHKCTGKLPKAHNIYSPYEYFKLFVDQDIIENMANQTNLYSVQKTGKCINTSCEEIEQFLGINMFMSIVKMAQYRMLWSNETRFPTVADTMSRNRFDNLRTFFHVNDNTEMLPREHKDHDKLFKVRPFLNYIRSNMRKIHVEEFTSVDEIIIPFKGRTLMKQYNKNKPHKWGIKLFAIASKSGIVHDFEIYIGKGTLPPSEHGLGISGDVVMRLSECIPKMRIISSPWITGSIHIIYNAN